MDIIIVFRWMYVVWFHSITQECSLGSNLFHAETSNDKSIYGDFPYLQVGWLLDHGKLTFSSSENNVSACQFLPYIYVYGVFNRWYILCTAYVLSFMYVLWKVILLWDLPSLEKTCISVLSKLLKHRTLIVEFVLLIMYIDLGQIHLPDSWTEFLDTTLSLLELNWFFI